MRNEKSKKKTKVGVLGGAFNPPTIGHIKMAEHALKNTDLDEVWLTPCYSHRDKSELLPPEDRIRMCQLALGPTGNIYTFRYEIDNKMEGSTFDFLSKLINDETCDVEISYIIGQDNANEFHKWHRYEELKSLCRFIVFGRNGIKSKEQEWYHNDPHIFLTWDFELCSSTMVRDHIFEHGRKKPISILNPVVQKFIKKHHLYSYKGDKIFELDTRGCNNMSEIFSKNPNLDKKDLLNALLSPDTKFQEPL